MNIKEKTMNTKFKPTPEEALEDAVAWNRKHKEWIDGCKKQAEKNRAFLKSPYEQLPVDNDPQKPKGDSGEAVDNANTPVDEELTPKEEFDMYQNIAKSAVKPPRAASIPADEKPDFAPFAKVNKIATSIKETSEGQYPTRAEALEGLFMLLEKTLDSMYKDQSSVLDKLHAIQEKYFSRKDSPGCRFDVIDQNGDLLLGVKCNRELLDQFGFAIVREIDENGFILRENPNASRKLINGTFVTDQSQMVNTKKPEKPFLEVTVEEKEGVSKCLGSTFVEQDRKLNEEFRKKLEEENKAKLDEGGKACSETAPKGEVKSKRARRQRKTAKGKKA